MIGNINHIAIAVRDVEAASRQWQETLGASCSKPLDLPEHGVRIVFVSQPNAKVELIEPLGEESPIAGFLERNPDGGMHHICYEVEDIISSRDQLVASGARVLGNGEPRTGAHGNPVLFLHPKDFCGTLIELEEVSY